jgi:hypothetical protein
MPGWIGRRPRRSDWRTRSAGIGVTPSRLQRFIGEGTHHGRGRTPRVRRRGILWRWPWRRAEFEFEFECRFAGGAIDWKLGKGHEWSDPLGRAALGRLRQGVARRPAPATLVIDAEHTINESRRRAGRLAGKTEQVTKPTAVQGITASKLPTSQDCAGLAGGAERSLVGPATHGGVGHMSGRSVFANDP